MKNQIATLLLLIALTTAAPATQSRAAMERDYIRGVIYLVTVADTARETPDVTAAEVGKVEPMNSLLVYKTVPGWIQVGLPRSPTFERGWIRGAVENMIKGDQLTVSLRTVQMDKIVGAKAWPPATRLAILRGQARIGFSKEQVTIAFSDLGSTPVSKASEETAAGVTETWAYEGQVITFKAGKVVSIKKVE